MYVCIAVSVCLCLPSKLRESGVVTIVAMFIIKATIFSIMPLMMTLLRHFTQQLNQICLYGDSTSIGQGQPIPQTRRCRQKMLFSDVFRQARFLSSQVCLHKGVWAGKLHENKGVLDQKAHFCLQEFTWFLLLQLSSSRLWGQLLAWHLVQVYLRESSNRITEKKKYWECNIWKKSVLFE